MLDRCYQESHKHYHRYGGRGIRVCEGWRMSFDAFLADMGPKPTPKHTIDREENEGHYSCGRCEECKANALIADGPR